jgi:hypothetical protein
VDRAARGAPAADYACPADTEDFRFCRCSFTPEFKAEIVDLCQLGDRSVGQVAEDFDLAETPVRECALYCRVP